MTNEEAISIIKSECYVMNLLNLDRTQMINQALDKAIKALEQQGHVWEIAYERGKVEALDMTIETSEQTRWIPVKWHIKTAEEEYEKYPNGVILIDSPMPEPYQDILITIKSKSGYYYVEKTIAYCGDDGWYVDDNYDWCDDIIAWMPLPEPYKE